MNTHLQSDEDDDYFDDNIPLEYMRLKDKYYEKVFASGMKWLHINDEEASSVTWNMRVGVGSLIESTPERTFPEGTAHLLEHSIFLNLTSDQQMMFTDWNAHTGDEETAFEYEAFRGDFLECFELTANLFFNFDYNPNTRREVNSVNNE